MGYSERIKELRLEKGFTQKELANQLQLTANSICEWEKGRCSPGIDHLIELSKIFECSIDYIVGISDDFGIISIKNEKATVKLSADEKELMDIFKSLHHEHQVQILEYARYFAMRNSTISPKKKA